jgi:cysteine desulfurase/selenocysteine lyase
VVPGASAAEGAAPAWLPDEQTLTRMAEQMFRALPGQEPGAASPPTEPAGGPPAAAAAGAGLPGADLPPPAPRSRPSPFGSASPTSVPATYGATGAGLALPMVPEVPTLVNLASSASAPASGTSPFGMPASPATDTGAFYFLSGAPGYTPAAPAVPGFGHTAAPEPSLAPAMPDGGRFYFLDPAVPPGEVPTLPLDPHPAFDVHAVRRDFPILSEQVNGRPLIWLDNAATTQKPQAVIDRLAEFYSRENSNIHRAAHELAARASDAYENARRTVARFIGAGSAEEIVFVRGTTEAINLVAKAWGPRNLHAGDEIVISHLEHHANIVPWQMLAEQTGAVLKVIPVDEDGQILLESYTSLLSDRTKLVSVTHVSNALGTVVPIQQVVDIGHRAGATVLIDAAQSVPHLPLDVASLGADFVAFSGHKVFGPTGIGVLYGREEVLADMPPWEGGGNMIADVTLERSIYQPPPGRFEAGTGNIADAVGLAAALDYVDRIGLPNIAAHEHALLEHATAGLREVPGLRLVGTAAEKASVVSFVLDGYQPAEVGTALNEEGIAVRAGHHCAQPILRRYGLEATVRPSLALYNTHDEVDTLVAAVHRLAARNGAGG